jgi:hypothetical protein
VAAGRRSPFLRIKLGVLTSSNGTSLLVVCLAMTAIFGPLAAVLGIAYCYFLGGMATFLS